MDSITTLSYAIERIGLEQVLFAWGYDRSVNIRNKTLAEKPTSSYPLEKVMRLLRNVSKSELELTDDSGREALGKLVMSCLNKISENENINNERKLAFFQEMRRGFGRTALLLSGGAGFGLYHIGVIKALYEANRLPRVVSGASAGSFYACWICSKNTNDLSRIFDTSSMAAEFFDENPGYLLRLLKRFWNEGVVFDAKRLEKAFKDNLGDVTFAESYAFSGRVVNVVVSRIVKGESSPLILNYLTSPHVLLWSACLASCSLSFAFPAAELQCKDPITKEIVPFLPGVKFKV